MFQCLGLGRAGEGGCGEDWWHPECSMGLPKVKEEVKQEVKQEEGVKRGEAEDVKLEGNATGNEGAAPAADQLPEEPPLPPGFPAEDDFDHLLCYKCTTAFPWIKSYAGTPGFLPAVSADPTKPTTSTSPSSLLPTQNGESKKREGDGCES